MDEHLLAEQIDYYRQLADEYDDFWARAGQYALAAEPLRRWRADAAQATDAVRAWVPAGDVLELACGTGLWTQHVAVVARTVVAVDAAPEMLARNAERLARHPARERVAYVEADLFTWAPPAAAFDGVFMGDGEHDAARRHPARHRPPSLTVRRGVIRRQDAHRGLPSTRPAGAGCAP